MSSGERGRAQSSGGNQQRTQYHNSSARMKMKISMLLFLLLLLPLLAAGKSVLTTRSKMHIPFVYFYMLYF